MKTCRICNEIKPLNAYGPAKSKNSSQFNANVIADFKPECRVCLAKEAREWRAKHKGYDGTGRFAPYKGDERKLVSAICQRISSAKTNNKRNERPFNITMEYMLDLWKQQNGKCKYTNQSLFVEKEHPAGLSIDKLQPKLGYTQGNVQWVAWAVNRAKGDLDEELFIQMCKAVVKGATTIP